MSDFARTLSMRPIQSTSAFGRRKKTSPTVIPPPPPPVQLEKAGKGFLQHLGVNDAVALTATNHSGHNFIACINASRMEGFVGTIFHSTLEPTQGAFDWTYLDGLLASARNTSLWWDGRPKLVGFRIFFGLRAASWATTDVPIADVDSPANNIVVPWMTVYQDRIAATWRAIAERYDNDPLVVLVQLSLIGTRQAELVMDDDGPRADGQALNLTVWHDRTLWTPNGVAADQYTRAKHVQMVNNAITTSLAAWKKTKIFLPLNRMGFTTTARNVWAQGAVAPRPSEQVASDVLDLLKARPESERWRILPGWTEFDNCRGAGADPCANVGGGQYLVDEVAADMNSWVSGTCWDWGAATPDTDIGYADSFNDFVTYKGSFFRIGPGDNNSAAKHTRFV